MRFEKPEQGHREIRDRSHGLVRTARMMLVLSDGQRTGDELLAMVNGATAADLALLLDQGLIIAVGAFGPGGDARSDRDTEDALRQFSDTAAAKEQLGLFKGYRFSLEIEKANGIDEMREVAQRFVLEVRKAKGESAAQMVRRALGLTA